jgi:hypothetical protein
MRYLLNADSGPSAKGVFWSVTCGVGPGCFEVSDTAVEICARRPALLW